MPTNELNTRIKNKIDTSTNWAQSTDVLLNGELAIVLDSNSAPEVKVGDGSNAFPNLKYLKTARIYEMNVTSSSGTLSNDMREITINHNLNTFMLWIEVLKTNNPSMYLAPIYIPDFDITNSNTIQVHFPNGYFSNTANTYTIYVIGIPE